MKRYRLVNKTRFYAFIIGMLTIIFSGTIIFGAQNVQGDMLEKYDVIIVNSGETIWEIAERYNNNKHKDLRQYVYEIKKANNIFGNMIKPNQKLKIPRTL